jgi:hypothetical protein
MAQLILSPRVPVFQGQLEIITHFVVHYEYAEGSSGATLTVTGRDKDNTLVTLINAASLPAGQKAAVLKVSGVMPVVRFDVTLNNSEKLIDLVGIDAVASHQMPVL